MLSKSDKKLSQQVKVLLERLPESDTPLINKNVKTNKLHKCPNYETFKKSNKEDINIKESNMPSSVKKEKKVFEEVDCKMERFSKVGHIYSCFVKSEKVILDAYTNPSSNIDLNRRVTSNPKNWYSKETKIEKETKESLKGIIESNISGKINLRKRPYSSKNDSERKIHSKNIVKPLIELVPVVVKTEESEIRTLKKIQRKARNVVEIDKETAEKSFTATPSSQELISQYADVSIVIHHKVLEMCKSIPHSSIKTLNSKRDSPVEEAPENKVAVESSHKTVGGSAPHVIDLEEESSANRGNIEFSHQAIEKLEDGLVKEGSLNGQTFESSCQTLERTEVSLSGKVPTNKNTFEYKSKIMVMPGEDFGGETSINDCAVDFIHQISKQQDQTLGKLGNCVIEEGPSNESIAKFSHQTLEKPEEEFVKEDSLERSSNSKTLVRSKEGFEDEASTNNSAEEYIHQSEDRIEVCLLDKVQTNKGAFESLSKTLGRSDKGFEVEASTNNSAVYLIHQISQRQDAGFETVPQDQSLGRLDNDFEEGSPLSESIAEINQHILEIPEDGLVKEDSLSRCTDESNSHTTLRSRECFEEKASTNYSTVEYIHQTSERQGTGSETLLQDHTLGRSGILEEGSSNGGTAECSHQTLDKPEDGLVKEDSSNRCTVESIHKTLGRTEVDLGEVPTNRKESHHKTLEMLGECFESSKNDTAVKYIQQIPEKLRGDVEDESSTNGSNTESSDRTLERPGVSPVEISQTLGVQHEPVTTFLNTDSTVTRKGFTSDNAIKVKAPQALGIQNQDIPQNPQNIRLENRLNISYLSQIRSASGNESKIAEICKVYPIFFTPEVRSDISVLIKILHKVSKGLTFKQIKSNQCDETYLLNIQNCGRMFVKTFNKILKLDQVGLDKDLLKKIIPILYLHMDKGFKRLRPVEDFDFRIIMKKMFETENFVCDHDVILEKNYEMFQKVMITFDRWLEDTFIECDVNDILKPFTALDNLGDDSISLSGQFSPDSLEDATMELGNDNLATSEPRVDSIKNTRKQDISVCGAAVERNYLQCQICRESLPMCCICKELLSCPCLSELHQTLAFDRGPTSLVFCREHSKCGDTWPQWLDDWIEEREDHNLPLNPVCWNVRCNNKAELLCVCRIQAYCSHACQVEDWYEEHHKSCRRESDPKCYSVPGEEDMDVS